MSDILSCIRDIIVSLAAVTTAIVAVIGVNSWRKELKGSSEFQTARNLIKSVYRLRDAIYDARSPLIRSSEFPPEYNLNNHKTKNDNADAYAHVFNNRWEFVAKAVQEFDVASLEAEALWFKESSNRTSELRQCLVEIRASTESFVSNAASGNQDFESDKKFGKSVRENVFSSRDSKDNKMNIKINNSIESIEEFLKSYIGRKSK